MRMSYKEKQVRNSKAAHVRSSKWLFQDKVNFRKCLCSVEGSHSSLDWAAESCGNYHKTLNFIIHCVTFTKCVFVNIRGEGLGAPSKLQPAHRCSGVHDVSVTSPAPTGPHLTFTIFCLETAWRSVPVVLIPVFVEPADASTTAIDFLLQISSSILILFLPL